MTSSTVAVRLFSSTSEAYDQTQWNDNIKDGDILVIPGEGIIGFLSVAWPVAVVLGPNGERGSFHTLAESDAGNAAREQYAESIRMCKSIAHADADITGNEHWREA